MYNYTVVLKHKKKRVIMGIEVRGIMTMILIISIVIVLTILLSLIINFVVGSITAIVAVSAGYIVLQDKNSENGLNLITEQYLNFKHRKFKKYVKFQKEQNNFYEKKIRYDMTNYVSFVQYRKEL